MPNRPEASRWWGIAWLAWSLVGVGSALVIIALHEFGVSTPRGIWWWWAVPGVGGGGTLELWALRNRARGDTFSEKVWSLEGGARSLIVAGVLWLCWWLATDVAWPSAGIAFLLWFAYHVRFDGPRGVRR